MALEKTGLGVYTNRHNQRQCDLTDEDKNIIYNHNGRISMILAERGDLTGLEGWNRFTIRARN